MTVIDSHRESLSQAPGAERQLENNEPAVGAQMRDLSRRCSKQMPHAASGTLLMAALLRRIATRALMGSSNSLAEDSTRLDKATQRHL